MSAMEKPMKAGVIYWFEQVTVLLQPVKKQ